MYYMGIDLHKKYFTTTMLNEEGEIVSQDKVTTSRESIKEYLKKMKEKGAIKGVVEATYNWPYFFDQAQDHFEELLLSHPGKTRAIASARIKTDSIDSNVLADLLRGDLIPRAYTPSFETRDVKNLLRYRISMIRVRTSIKNKVHGILDRNYVEDEILRRLSDKFTKRGMNIMKELKLKGNDTKILQGYLDLIEILNGKVKEIEAQIKRLVEEDEITNLLKTIPGIGNFFSLLIRYEIDDMERFPSPKKLFSYAGLVPSTHASGGKIYHGHITKQGNRYIRWAMTEAAQVAALNSSSLRRYYLKIKIKKGANAATIALARKLLGIVYIIWKQRTPYREQEEIYD